MSDPDVPYCWDGCGRPVTHERLAGMNGDTPIVELVCDEHLDALAHVHSIHNSISTIRETLSP